MIQAPGADVIQIPLKCTAVILTLIFIGLKYGGKLHSNKVGYTTISTYFSRNWVFLLCLERPTEAQQFPEFSRMADNLSSSVQMMLTHFKSNQN